MESAANYRVLVVDDSTTVRTGIRVLLENAGYSVETASCGTEALKKVRSFAPHCILLDFFMPGMTGGEVVEKVRGFDALVQIVLVTGQADRRPAREMMSRLDIQGYHDKAQGLEGVLVWVDAAIKAWERERTMARRAKKLEQIVVVSERLHRLHPPAEMGELALQSLAEVCGLDGPPDGFRATLDVDGIPRLKETTGQFQSCVRFEDLDEECAQVAVQALTDSELKRSERCLAVSIDMGRGPRSVLLLRSRNIRHIEDEHMLLVGHQVALAMENFRLFEMATQDSLTGLMSRAHFMNRFRVALKHSIRRQSPLSVLLVDLNDFKQINDTWGHPAGDAALSHFGAILQDCVREVDLAGRIGGDEFLVVLVDCFPRLAIKIAQRIQSRLESSTVEHSGMEFPISASIGAGGFNTLPLTDWMRAGQSEAVWQGLVSRLTGLVDEAAYLAKRDGTGIEVAGEDGDLAPVLTSFALGEDEPPGRL